MSSACTPILVGVAFFGFGDMATIQKGPNFPFRAWTMSSKILINRNWLKKFMQLEIPYLHEFLTQPKHYKFASIISARVKHHKGNIDYRNDSSWKTWSTACKIGCVFLFLLIKLCAFEISAQH